MINFFLIKYNNAKTKMDFNSLDERMYEKLKRPLYSMDLKENDIITTSYLFHDHVQCHMLI